MRKCSGLTLVELIVSMFILSIMSVVALSSFQQMIRAREVQKAHEAVLSQWSFAYTTIMNDIEQPMKAENMMFNEHMIALTHQAPDESSVHIEYAWENDSLRRTITQGTETREQVLIKNVSSLRWEWLSEDTWYDVSVPAQKDATLKGFKISFTDPMGEVSWIFALP